MARTPKATTKDQRSSKEFTRVTTDLLMGVRDLVNWGIDTGNTTPEQIRLTIAARRETAIKLIEGGASQRQVAKLLGVGLGTVQRDLTQSGSKSDPKRVTGSAETKAHRAAVAEQAAAGGITEIPGDKYRIICADPPWSYGNTQPDYHTEQRDHYPVMELDAICAMPIQAWAQDDAVLFLWVTAPILEESFQVIQAWGFKYKTCFVWDKIKHNMGHYNSVRHELLLLCTRGSCPLDNKQLFDSVQNIERTAHSAKPAEFFDIIETIYTRGRRLQVFSRQHRDGWDDYGHIAELRGFDVAAE